MTPVRVGCVRYLNARPLIAGWRGEVVFDHPATLCEKLARGEFDVAFVSSFEYLRNPIYTIVDGVCVGSDGAVYSVFIAHLGEVSEIKTISLDPASQTSVNLLRCLLAKNNLAPELIPPNESEITRTHAKLLIGDQAIRFRQQRADRYRYWDLGEEWRRATALPFVFALWLIHPTASAPEKIAAELRALRHANLARRDQLAANEADFAPEFCARYFTDFIKYDFGAREKEGLLRFRSLCEENRLLEPTNAPLRLA